MFKNFLAILGGVVLVMWVLGALGIGNFVLMYDANPILCVRGV